VVHVDDEVARGEALDVAEGEAAADPPAPPGRRAVVAVEHLVVGVDGEPGFGEDEPLVEALDRECGVRLLVLIRQELAEAGPLARGVAEEVGLDALGLELGEVLAEAADVGVERGLRAGLEGEALVPLRGEGPEQEAGKRASPSASASPETYRASGGWVREASEASA
jgi:hypothetical protein